MLGVASSMAIRQQAVMQQLIRPKDRFSGDTTTRNNNLMLPGKVRESASPTPPAFLGQPTQPKLHPNDLINWLFKRVSVAVAQFWTQTRLGELLKSKQQQEQARQKAASWIA